MLSPGVKRISSFITVKYPNNAKLKATWNKLKILIKTEITRDNTGYYNIQYTDVK